MTNMSVWKFLKTAATTSQKDMMAEAKRRTNGGEFDINLQAETMFRPATETIKMQSNVNVFDVQTELTPDHAYHTSIANNTGNFIGPGGSQINLPAGINGVFVADGKMYKGNLFDRGQREGAGLSGVIYIKKSDAEKYKVSLTMPKKERTNENDPVYEDALVEDLDENEGIVEAAYNGEGTEKQKALMEKAGIKADDDVIAIPVINEVKHFSHLADVTPWYNRNYDQNQIKEAQYSQQNKQNMNKYVVH